VIPAARGGSRPAITSACSPASDSALRDSVDAALREGDGATGKPGADPAALGTCVDEGQGALFEAPCLRGGVTAQASARAGRRSGPRPILAVAGRAARRGVTLAGSALVGWQLAVIVGLALRSSGRASMDPAGFACWLTVYIEIVRRQRPLLLQLFRHLLRPCRASYDCRRFLAAVLALGLNYAALRSGDLFAARPPGRFSRAQLEAARTLGFSELQILRLNSGGPQALRYALAPMTNGLRGNC